MVIITIAVAFILLSAGLAFCGWRFLGTFKKNYNQKTQSKIGFLLSLYFLGFTFQTGGILGLGLIFLVKNLTGFFLLLIIAHSFLVFLAILGTYTAYFIFWPKNSPWLAITFVSVLGVLGVILTIIAHPYPVLTSYGGVDWSLPQSLSLIIFFLLLSSIGAVFYVFARLFFQSKTNEIKMLSLILTIMTAGGIIDAFIQFVLLYGESASLRANTHNIFIGLVGVGSLLAFLALSCNKPVKT